MGGTLQLSRVAFMARLSFREHALLGVAVAGH
jgi:hypothetical protein